MQFMPEQFLCQPQGKIYVAEASKLGLAPGNMDPQMSIGYMSFHYHSTDYDSKGQNIVGWRFKVTLGTVMSTPGSVGWSALIIND